MNLCNLLVGMGEICVRLMILWAHLLVSVNEICFFFVVWIEKKFKYSFNRQALEPFAVHNNDKPSLGAPFLWLLVAFLMKGNCIVYRMNFKVDKANNKYCSDIQYNTMFNIEVESR